jgi:hypothetical protein
MFAWHLLCTRSLASVGPIASRRLDWVVLKGFGDAFGSGPGIVLRPH